MTPQHPARRTSAALLATVIGFSGIAAAPIAVNAADQTAAVTQASSQERQIKDATLDWGVKKSFRNYLVGPIAKGEDKTEEGLKKNQDGTYDWSQGTGTFDGTNGTVSLPGKLSFTGHDGILEMHFTNMRLEIKGNQGTLIADVNSRPFIDTTTKGELEMHQNARIATVDLSGLKKSEDALSVSDAKVTLTEAGAPAFGGFYEAGQELDPLSFNAPLSAKDGDPEPSPSSSTTAEPSPSATSEQPSKQPSDPSPSASATSSAPASNNGSGNANTGTSGQSTASSQREVASGSMSWGVRESFRKYIKGPIARGTWTVSGVKDNNGIFTYQNASGFYDASTRTGQINYPGTIHFTGHKGILDMTITNARLQIKDGKGTLVADVSSRKFVDTTTMGEMEQYKNVALGNVDLSGATLTGDTISAQNAPVTLSSKGADAFGGFYAAGEKLDPLSFSAKLGKTISAEDQASLDAADTSAGSGAGANLQGEGDESSTGTAAQGGTSSDAAGTSGGAAAGATSSDPGEAALQCVPVTVTDTVTPSAQAEAGSGEGTVSSASMSWGLKSSFRNYISGGIAKGKWDLSGVSYSGGAYQWSEGSGNFSGGNGTISFPGTIHFTGHKGILDTKLSDFSLEIKGNTGTLHATISSNDMEGKGKDYGNVVFANVDLSGLSTSGGKVSVSGAKTTLTQTGADAFANFYEAGQELDPLSFSATVSEEKAAAPAASPQVVTRTEYQGPGCDNLASTGAQQPLKIAGIGLAILAAGSGAVFFARRRRTAGQR